MIQEDLFNKITKFINSTYFLIIIGLINVISWKFDSFFLLTFFNLLAVLALYYFKGNKLLILLLFFSYLSGTRYTDMDFLSTEFILSYICLALTFIILIIDIVKIRKKLKLKNIIIICFAVYTLSGIISFINTPTLPISFMRIGILLGLLFLIIYLYSIVEYNDSNKKYILKIMIIISFCIISQMGLVYFELYDSENPFTIIKRKGLILGWAIGNRYSSILSLSLISTFYFYMTSDLLRKKILSCLIMIIQALAILICLSRGAILGMGLAAIPLAFYVFFYSKNKIKEIVAVVCVIGITLLSINLLSNIEVFKEMFDLLKNLDYSNDSGRGPLSDLAISQFKENWFIGSGIGSSRYYITTILNADLVHYHNFIYQLLAEQGIVGIITFLLFLISILLVCIKKDVYRGIIVCMVVYMMGHGLVDTTFHSPSILPLFMILIVFLATSQKKEILIEEKSS